MLKLISTIQNYFYFRSINLDFIIHIYIYTIMHIISKNFVMPKFNGSKNEIFLLKKFKMTHSARMRYTNILQKQWNIYVTIIKSKIN